MTFHPDSIALRINCYSEDSIACQTLGRSQVVKRVKAEKHNIIIGVIEHWPLIRLACYRTCHRQRGKRLSEINPADSSTVFHHHENVENVKKMSERRKDRAKQFNNYRAILLKRHRAM